MNAQVYAFKEVLKLLKYLQASWVLHQLLF